MLDNQVALNSITQAWAVLLQITVTNNWQDIARFQSVSHHFDALLL